MDIAYNGDGERIRMSVPKPTTTASSKIVGGYYDIHYYFGNKLEIIHDTRANKCRYVFYVGGDAYDAPAVSIQDGGLGEDTYYICRDYLGSMTLVADASGNPVQELSYDAWGNLRDPATHQVYALDRMPDLFLGRGYTGHEHLPMFGLVNMNARLYDPVMGRFLSPDPYVQSPDNLQSFNRYSYCLNNPLLYTDKSGALFGIDDLFIILGMAYIGGMQANFSHAAENGKNPFNPGSWNWGSASTYTGMIGGAIGGVGMAGYPIPHTQIPGIISNGALQAGAQVGLNGLGNLTDGRKFFDNWYWSAGLGFLSGGMAGYGISKEKNLNYWWGSNVAYNRTQWSFINTDIPDEVIHFNIPKVGSQTANDCVPTTFAEIERKLGGERSYEYFKVSTNYVDQVGVTIGGDEYEKLIRNTFTNVETLTVKEVNGKVLNPDYMRSVADNNGIISIKFKDHADNVNKLKVFYNAPWKNAVTFRNSAYNFNQRNYKYSNLRVFHLF